MSLVRAFIVLLVAGMAWPAAAQSLAAVARKEEARRKQVKQQAPVLPTTAWGPVTPPVASGTPDQPAGPDQPAAGAGDPAAPPTSSVDAELQAREDDQKAWRTKMADARQALERSQMYADALQSKINALWAEFTARDNPIERAQIELDRKKALAEQERVKAEVEAQKKAIADLEEEARRAGIPPGWIR
jgi:hypothetical protein